MAVLANFLEFSLFRNCYFTSCCLNMVVAYFVLFVSENVLFLSSIAACTYTHKKITEVVKFIYYYLYFFYIVFSCR